MAVQGLKLTRDDRKWLREIGIDPQPTIQDDMLDILSEPPKYLPNRLLISAELARKVIAEFGELTIDNVWAYRKKHQA